MPHVSANGIEIYYERRGSGPRLLFFNGSGATLAQDGMLLDPFAERFEVLVHDQRGLGQTSIPPGPYEMADYAADAAALLDAQGWDRLPRRGHELRRHGRVGVRGHVARTGRAAGAGLHVARRRRTRRHPLPGSPAPSGGDAPAADATLYDTRFTPEWLAAHDDDRTLIELIGRRRSTPDTGETRRGQLEQLGARSRHDCVDRLVAITCPTFVASGRYDGIAPPENGEAIADRVPRTPSSSSTRVATSSSRRTVPRFPRSSNSSPSATTSGQAESHAVATAAPNTDASVR